MALCWVFFLSVWHSFDSHTSQNTKLNLKCSSTFNDISCLSSAKIPYSGIFAVMKKNLFYTHKTLYKWRLSVEFEKSRKSENFLHSSLFFHFCNSLDLNKTEFVSDYNAVVFQFRLECFSSLLLGNICRNVCQMIIFMSSSVHVTLKN